MTCIIPVEIFSEYILPHFETLDDIIHLAKCFTITQTNNGTLEHKYMSEIKRRRIYVKIVNKIKNTKIDKTYASVCKGNSETIDSYITNAKSEIDYLSDLYLYEKPTKKTQLNHSSQLNILRQYGIQFHILYESTITNRCPTPSMSYNNILNRVDNSSFQSPETKVLLLRNCHCRNNTKSYIRLNDFSTVEPLQNLDNLTYIKLENCIYFDISNLKSLTHLELIDCGFIAGIEKNTQLKELILIDKTFRVVLDHPMYSYDVYGSVSSTTCACYHSYRYRSLSEHMNKFTNLETLHLEFTSISNLSELTQLKNLTILHSDVFVELPPLDNIPCVKIYNCHGMKNITKTNNEYIDLS